MLEFKKLGYEDVFTVRNHFITDNEIRNKRGADITCDYVFGTTFLWRDYYNTKYCVTNDSLILQITNGGIEMYSSPIGEDNISDTLKAVREYSHSEGKALYFCFVPEQDLHYYREAFDIVFSSEEPDWSDYVYDKECLTDYPGRRYHGQKNFYNRYRKNNPDAVFIPIDGSNTDVVREYALAWYSKYSDKSAMSAAEEKAVYDLLNNWNNNPGISGGYITSNEGIAGFTIGETVGDTVYIHIEKAEHTVSGAYQFLSSEYLRNITDRDVKFVNREEDMGIEGLRKSKISLHPVKLLKKYTLYCC